MVTAALADSGANDISGVPCGALPDGIILKHTFLCAAPERPHQRVRAASAPPALVAQDDVTNKLDFTSTDTTGYASDRTADTAITDVPADAGYASDLTVESRGGAESASDSLKRQDRQDEEPVTVIPVEYKPHSGFSEKLKNRPQRKKQQQGRSATTRSTASRAEEISDKKPKRSVKEAEDHEHFVERERTEAMLDQVMLYCAALVVLLLLVNVISQYLQSLVAVMFPCCVVSAIPAFMAPSRWGMVRNFLTSLSICALALCCTKLR
jgi:hypothetical protein